MADAPKKQPPLIVHNFGVASFAGIHLGNDVWILTNNGSPSNGTSGTGAGYMGKGSMIIDRSNGAFYANTGTKASPTWTEAT